MQRPVLRGLMRPITPSHFTFGGEALQIFNKSNGGARDMSERTQIVSVGGVDLATRIDGEAGRPWIVLSNSLAGRYEAWDLQIPLLTQTHQVLRYDTRGHGRSASPPGPYTFKDLTGDMLGLMDRFGIGHADLLGLSMGGMTALGLAIEHPDRIGRVICCDGRADAVPPFVASWDARIAAIREAGGMLGIVPFTIERWFTPKFRDSHPEVVQATIDMILTTKPDGYIACAAALKQLDYKPLLGTIKARVLYICGAQDQAAPPAVMRDMAALTPRAAYAEVDPGAHVCNVENPEGFNRILESWLGGCNNAG
jgi:3-oxoadipate enol-lactonase